MASSAGYNEEVVGIPFLGDKDARPIINGVKYFCTSNFYKARI
jgi:hypothetical protein